MGELLFYLLPIIILIATITVRIDTKKHIQQGNEIIASLNKYIDKEQKR